MRISDWSSDVCSSDLKSGLLSPGTLKLALVFLGHHQAHRDSLPKLVADAGGKPVEPKTDAQYIEELKLGSLKTEGDVVALATALQRGAASAYLGQHAALRQRSEERRGGNGRGSRTTSRG